MNVKTKKQYGHTLFKVPHYGHAMAQAVKSPASHHRGLCLHPAQSMWDLWWTKQNGRGFSLSSLVSPCQCHFIRLILMYHLEDAQQASWWPQFRHVLSPHQHEQQKQHGISLNIPGRTWGTHKINQSGQMAPRVRTEPETRLLTSQSQCWIISTTKETFIHSQQLS
jgi:hypothetical protein